MNADTGAPRTQVDRGDEHDEDLEFLKNSKARLWPYLVVLLVAVAGGAFYLYQESQKRVPLRVLVAIDSDGYWWQGSPVSAALSDRLAEQLSSLGFETVNGGDPAIVERIERATSAREAARLLKAGFVVTGDLSPQINELPVESKYYEARVNGQLQVGFMDEPLQDVGPIESWSGARDKARALDLLGQGLGDVVFQRALAGLMAHEHVRRIVEGDDAVARGLLSKAESYVELRDDVVSTAEAEYEKLFEAQAKDEEAGRNLKFHTRFRTSDLLCATGSHGFLVQRSRAQPFYDLEDKVLLYFRDMDELLWIKHDGSEEPVTSAYNLYGYANAHASGYPVVYIEDLYGWAKTITVTQEDKSTSRLRIDPEHRFSDPKISLDKKLVAVHDRSCRRCTDGLLVLDIATKDQVFALPGEAGPVGSFGFAGSDSLFFVHQPASEGDTPAPVEIRRIDFSVAPPEQTVFYTFEPYEQASWLSVGEHGRWFVVLAQLDDGPAALIFDTDTGNQTQHPAGTTVRSMTASPTAREIAYESRGEIFHFDLDTEVETQLTSNRRRDRYPYFSADGQRIYFEGLADDPNFSRRSVSAIASVKVP